MGVARWGCFEEEILERRLSSLGDVIIFGGCGIFGMDLGELALFFVVRWD